MLDKLWKQLNHQAVVAIQARDRYFLTPGWSLTKAARLSELIQAIEAHHRTKAKIRLTMQK